MTVVTVPGEYYEKVYSNSITTMRHLLLSNVLSSFDIYSIVRRNEETMLTNYEQQSRGCKGKENLI